MGTRSIKAPPPTVLIVPKTPSPPPTEKKKKGYIVDELSNLPDKQRKLISRIYDIIMRNLPPEQSEELIGKIQEELKYAKKNSAD